MVSSLVKGDIIFFSVLPNPDDTSFFLINIRLKVFLYNLIGKFYLDRSITVEMSLGILESDG